MSQLVRLEGKHSTQNAHCALARSPSWICKIANVLARQVGAVGPGLDALLAPSQVDIVVQVEIHNPRHH